MNEITLILCADDLSSVQSFRINTYKTLAETTAYGSVQLGLPEGFHLIAAVEGWPRLMTRDDARTEEWGVQ